MSSLYYEVARQIVNAADPVHSIHLRTSSGDIQKDEFHYRDNLAAVWTFTWKQDGLLGPDTGIW